MKKRALAPAMAIAIAAGSVVAVGQADAQEFTAAELYEPTIGGIWDLGPDERSTYLLVGDGPRVASVDLNLFESPYPGLKMERDYSPYSAPDRVKLRLEGGRIYPDSFDVLVGVTVHYDDGSSEYVEGPFTVRPLRTLVAGRPAEPSKPTTTPRATVSVTATTTVTEFYPEPYPDPYPVYETETVTTTTTEYYAEPYPEISYQTETVIVTATETVPGDPVTVTATASANPVTVTETPAPETVVATETATIVKTVTKTASAEADESGSSLSTGGIVGIVLAVLAALGAGAFALSGGLPPQIAKALPF